MLLIQGFIHILLIIFDILYIEHPFQWLLNFLLLANGIGHEYLQVQFSFVEHLLN